MHIRNIARAGHAALTRVRGAVASNWFKPFRSAGLLLAGRSVRGVLTLAYVAVAARALGVSDFGSLMLIQTLAMAFSKLAGIPSWQTLLSYGTTPLIDNDRGQFHRILKFAFLLDGLAALSGVVLVLAVMLPAANLVAVPPVDQPAARIYGLGVIFGALASAPGGVLRMLDRFDLLAVHSTLTPVIRLLGASILWATGGGVTGFLVVWFVGWLAGTGFLWIVSLRLLVRGGYLRGLTWSFFGLGRPARGIWRFTLMAYLNSTLSMVQLRLPLLGAGILFGPAAAGLFRVAQQIAEVTVGPVARLLLPSMYPELSRLHAEERWAELRIMMARTMFLLAGLASVVVIILVLFGQSLISLIAGAGFVSAYPVMLWLAAGGALESVTAPIEPLLLSSGHAGKAAFARALATGVFVVALIVLMTALGLVGAGMAYVFYAVTLGLLFASAALRLGYGRQT